ncbi:hypothetical protein [Actinomyces bowdenii]|nr:hypothetical protein [Actinomyces bowdenii]
MKWALEVRLPDSAPQQRAALLGVWESADAALGDQSAWFVSRQSGADVAGHVSWICCLEPPSDSITTQVVQELEARGLQSGAVSHQPQGILQSAGFTGSAFGTRVDRLFSDARPVLLNLVRDIVGASYEERYAIHAGLLVAHASAAAESSELLERSLLSRKRAVELRLFSLQSHLQGLLAAVADQDRVLASFKTVYEPISDVIRGLVMDALSGLVSHQGWFALETAHLPMVRREFAVGDIRVSTAGFEGLDAPGSEPALPSRRFASTDEYRDALRYFLHQTADFQAFRLLSSAAYQASFDIGLSIQERYFLCYAVSRATQDVTGMTLVEALDRVREIAIASREADCLDRLPESLPLWRECRDSCH